MDHPNPTGLLTMRGSRSDEILEKKSVIGEFTYLVGWIESELLGTHSTLRY